MQEWECFNFKVYGHVQGVGFRYFTLKTARELQLFGFVSNSSDGCVVGSVSGPRPLIESFLASIRIGPPLSRVDDVVVESGNSSVFENFEIRADS